MLGPLHRAAAAASSRPRRAAAPSGTPPGSRLFTHASPGAIAAAGPPGLRPIDGPSAPAFNTVAGPVVNAPAPIGDASWALLAIAQQATTIVGLDGAPLRLPDGTPLGGGGGGELRHWLDAALASACVVQARWALWRALADRDGLALAECLQWIAAAYNCLNIPWQIDPPARMLWRRYFSGPATDLATEFAGGGPTGADWNACTGIAQQLDPRAFVCTSPVGLIPAAGRAVFAHCAPAGARDAVGQFVAWHWIGQAQPPGAAPVLRGDAPGVRPTRDGDRVQAIALALQNFADSRGGAFGQARDAACAPLAAGVDVVNTWDRYGFDAGFVGSSPPPLRYSAAQADFAPWLSDWLDALEARTATQVVLQARLFGTYLNLRTANGVDLAQLAQAQGHSIGDEFASNPVAQQDLHVAQVGAGALAAVLGSLAIAAGASAPLTAGVGALVMGSITAGAAIAAALWPPDLSDFRLDDLLRPRPWIERGWLAGSPGDASAHGAPVEVMVLAPPDWTRPATPSSYGGGAGAGGSSAPPASSGGAGTVALAAAGALGVGALIAQLSGAVNIAGFVRDTFGSSRRR
jgi:hypothetical protein